MNNLTVIFEELENVTSADPRYGSALHGSSITTTLDESFDYGTIRYINESPSPFTPGLGVVLTFLTNLSAITFNMIINSDSVSIAERSPTQPTKYLHNIALIEATAKLSKYTFGGMAFPRINGKTWTVEEAINRILDSEPLHNKDGTQKFFFLPNAVSADKEIPELSLNSGVLLDALNAIANTIDGVVYADQYGVIQIRALKSSIYEAKTTNIYNYQITKSLSDYSNSVAAFISSGLPDSTSKTVGGNHPLSPRSETIYCRTDNMKLTTDFPIYQIKKVYAYVHIPDTGSFPVETSSPYTAPNEIGISVHDKFCMVTYPALGFLKVDITEAFVTAEKYSTMSAEDMNMHYAYVQGSNEIDFTAVSQDNPYFQEDKIKNVIDRILRRKNAKYRDSMIKIMKDNGYTERNSTYGTSIFSPTYQLNGRVLYDGYSYSPTPHGFNFKFEIEYYPLVNARFITLKKGETTPKFQETATASESIVSLNRMGEKSQGIADQIGNSEMTLNRLVPTLDGINMIGNYINYEGEKFVLSSSTIIYNLEGYDLTETYVKNFNRRSTYTGTDIVYRETTRDSNDVPRYLHYYDSSRTVSRSSIPSNLFARCYLCTTEGRYLGDEFLTDVASTIYGNTLALVINLKKANTVGNKVVTVDKHNELSPVSLAKIDLPKENYLKVIICSTRKPTIMPFVDNLSFIANASYHPSGNTSVFKLDNDMMSAEIDQTLAFGPLYPNQKDYRARAAFPKGYYIIKNASFTNDENTISLKNRANKFYYWLGELEDDIPYVWQYYGSTYTDSDFIANSKISADEAPQWFDGLTTNGYRARHAVLYTYDLKINKSETEAITLTIQIPLAD